jgi:AcrR family transcriptional regulator
MQAEAIEARGAKVSAKPTLPAGRPRGGDTEVTRTRILDAAEELFADFGYDGTSTRDIAVASGNAVAVITYHFVTKENLFDTVIARRAVPMCEQRREGLIAAIKTEGNRPVPVVVLLRIFVTPFIEKAHRGDRGWRNYAALMGRLANSPRGTSVIHKHYDEVAQLFVRELMRSLPRVSAASVVRGFMAVSSAMLFICAATGRNEEILSMLGATRDETDSIEELVRFCAAGFAELTRLTDRT